MTLLLWHLALTLGLIYLPAGPWSAVSLLLLAVVMLAGCWVIGIAGSDRALPSVLAYIVSYGVYCYQLGWIAERVNLMLAGTPDPWPLVATAALAFIVPAAFVVSPFSQWLYETAPDEQVPAG